MLTVQPIQKHQDAAIAAIITSVGAEFGAVGEGFGPSDAEVNAMNAHYREDKGAVYYVALLDGQVVGGGGIAPVDGEAGLCELRKLFLLPQARGQGIGRELTERCLNFAKSRGYSACYLDTLYNMTAAIALYERMGFERLDKPLAASIHNGCDTWMLKTFSTKSTQPNDLSGL